MTYTGYTDETPKNFILDAGAFFKNFYVGSDTYETAVTAGKLLGATSGGGTFAAVPTIRPIAIDGIKGDAKGAVVIDRWDCTLSAVMKEAAKNMLAQSLITGRIDTSTDANYDIITADSEIRLTDYVENITWIGRLAGSNIPVIIQIYNALNTNGLTLNFVDKNEAAPSLSFKAHSAGGANAPFKIYYPKAIVNTATLSASTFSKASPVDIVATITSSGGAVCGGVKLGTEEISNLYYTIGSGTVTLKKEYLGTLSNGAKTFVLLMDKGNHITLSAITVGA